MTKDIDEMRHCPTCTCDHYQVLVEFDPAKKPSKIYYLHCDTCHECEDVTESNSSPEFDAKHKTHQTRIASIP